MLRLVMNIIATDDNQHSLLELERSIKEALPDCMPVCFTTSEIEEVNHLSCPACVSHEKKLRVQCFGNFEVFANGKPLYFPRSKSKEMFAYLIHKKGTSSTTRELAAVLFEDNDSINIQPYISTMMKVLSDCGAKDIVVKQYNSLSVDTSKLDCDYYRFLQHDTGAINEYVGEYMSNYIWADYIISYLDDTRQKIYV